MASGGLMRGGGAMARVSTEGARVACCAAGLWGQPGDRTGRAGRYKGESTAR